MLSNPLPYTLNSMSEIGVDNDVKTCPSDEDHEDFSVNAFLSPLGGGREEHDHELEHDQSSPSKTSTEEEHEHEHGRKSLCRQSLLSCLSLEWL